jgi:peptide-methionine (R)-S-oxide reductase
MKRYLQLLILPVIAFGFMAVWKQIKVKSNCSRNNYAATRIIIEWYFLDKSGKTEAEWEKTLTEKQYYILRKQGTNALSKWI